MWRIKCPWHHQASTCCALCSYLLVSFVAQQRVDREQAEALPLNTAQQQAFDAVLASALGRDTTQPRTLFFVDGPAIDSTS